MSEEEKESSEEMKSREEKMKEMKEKVKEMYGNKGGEGQSPPGPKGMGQASLMNRMASMQGGSQGGRQTKALIRSMNELRTETKEMKRYLKEILEILKEKE